MFKPPSATHVQAATRDENPKPNEKTRIGALRARAPGSKTFLFMCCHLSSYVCFRALCLKRLATERALTVKPG